MALKIISGLARGIALDTPPDRSMRPTSGRSREALFSSLGPMEGKRFNDIFAGSGAMALEAASRGAAAVAMLEGNPKHTKLIEQNAAKLRKAGVAADIQIVGRKFSCNTLQLMPKADIWFFDPPYAQSADFMQMLLAGDCLDNCLSNALLIWELPDTAEARSAFLSVEALAQKLDYKLRNLGGTDFIFARRREDV
ncbi:MAG: 16S rRNA (guanine(966)-N(2))-methyltransferase RsmD [Lentisphaerae bacterium]|nr:16S rRNA (guanine(966)-N(2))-methyltransferase RsmD [Lentisphaerota bacterium]